MGVGPGKRVVVAQGSFKIVLIFADLAQSGVLIRRLKFLTVSTVLS